MSWNAVPVAIMAGIAGYAAMLFMGIYASLAKLTEEGSRRDNLSFAWFCLTVVAYDVTCVGAYDARSLAQGFFWMRGNLITAALLGIAYMRFTLDFLRKPVSRLVRWNIVILGVLGPLVSFWESEYTLTIARPAIKHVPLFGRDLIYYEVEAGVVAQTLLLLPFLTYGICIGALIRYFRSHSGRQQRGRVGFLFASVVSGGGTVNDVLVALGVYKAPYATEYGCTAILIAMGYVLLMRFGELHEVLNGLNANLSKANADLAVALEQARESVRLKTEFLASISHELRTPLNAIINLPEGMAADFVSAGRIVCQSCSAEFELEEGEQLDASAPCPECARCAWRELERSQFVGDASKARKRLNIVSRAGRHLLGLVNDILDASKLELGRTILAPESFDMMELVREVVDSTRSTAAEQHIAVRVHEADAPIGAIVADRGKIAQVLYNVIANAIKFSPAGSAVDVSVIEATRDSCTLCVRDYGIGIAPVNHALIFEKFHQVDGGATRRHGGTGLGLAISKSLVELHHGEIRVESEVGKGAAFFVRLPRMPVMALPSAAPANANEKLRVFQPEQLAVPGAEVSHK